MGRERLLTPRARNGGGLTRQRRWLKANGAHCADAAVRPKKCKLPGRSGKFEISAGSSLLYKNRILGFKSVLFLFLSLSLLLNWIGNVSQPWRPHTQPITSISLRSIKSMNRLIETIHTFTLASLVLPLSLFPALDRIEWKDFGLLYIKVGTCWGLPFLTPTECWDFFTPSPLFVHKIYTFVGKLGIFWTPHPPPVRTGRTYMEGPNSPSDSRKV